MARAADVEETALERIATALEEIAMCLRRPQPPRLDLTAWKLQRIADDEAEDSE